MEHEVKENAGLLEWLDRLEQQNVNKATIEFGMNHYLDRVARERGVPLKGTFELTPLCNLNCRMCYVHLSQEQLRNSNKTLLTGEQWKSIIRQAVDGGLMYALLTGGEAMLHPDFDEIYLCLHHLGVQATVNTNGLLLDAQRVAFFKKHPPREIRVTLYGTNDDAYEAVTGRRAFTQAIEGIGRAKEAGLTVAVNVTPNRYISVEETMTLVQLVRSMGVRYGINSMLSTPRTETGRAQDVHDMTMDEYIQLQKRVNQLEGKQKESLCEEAVPRAGGAVRDELRGFRCGGGRSSFAIVWHGAMQPCLSFEGVQVSLADMSVKQAWQQVNQAVRDYPVPRECSGCAFEQVCPVCVVLHAEDAPLGHASPRLCERARRLMREGLISL